MTLDYSPLSWDSVLYATEAHLPIAVRQMPRRQVKNGLPPSVNFYHNYALEDAFPKLSRFSSTPVEQTYKMVRIIQKNFKLDSERALGAPDSDYEQDSGKRSAAWLS
jgi:hypothetical protein